MLIKKMRKKKQKSENIKFYIFLKTLPSNILLILLITIIAMTFNYYTTYKTNSFNKNATLQSIITIDQKRNEIIKYKSPDEIKKNKAQRI